MTERLMSSLRDELHTRKRSEWAYLDLWRTFRAEGFSVAVVEAKVGNFPKVKDEHGRAYIPQSCLIAVFKKGDGRLKDSLDAYRAKRNREVFGGLTNDQIKLLLHDQIHDSFKDQREQVTSIKTLPLRFIPVGLVALAAQILDQSSSTPAFAQGRIKDAIAVPVFAYTIPFSRSPSKNALIHTALLTTWEFMQKYNPFSSWMTYDPFDIAAYGLGAIVFVGYKEVQKRRRSVS